MPRFGSKSAALHAAPASGPNLALLLSVETARRPNDASSPRGVALLALAAACCGGAEPPETVTPRACAQAATLNLACQGTLEETQDLLDLAIVGPGFFIFRPTSPAGSAPLFSRDGALGIDEYGFVVNCHGNRLQGYAAGANGVLAARMGDLNIGGVPRCQ